MQPDLVQVNMSAPFPLTVVLPLRLHAEYKVDRRFVITSSTQLVPAGVKAWMQKDRHYARYFEAFDDSATEVAEGKAAKPAAARSDKKKAESSTAQGKNGAGAANPARNPAESGGKTAKDEGFNPAWNVTALRNYAVQHKIALTRDDNKRAGLIDKLTAAGLKPIPAPAEAAEVPTPPATEPKAT